MGTWLVAKRGFLSLALSALNHELNVADCSDPLTPSTAYLFLGKMQPAELAFPAPLK